MTNHAIYLIVLFSVIGGFYSGHSQYDKTFDYFKFILTWSNSECSRQVCRINPIPQDFTIHGFWPTNNFGAYLHDCYESPYTPIEWQDLIDKLNKYWVNLFDGTDFNSLTWSHEWEKHGTCSLIFYYQLMYFDLAVELRESFDILGGLREREIVPTNLFMYSIQEVKDAVKDYTRKVPDIQCVYSVRGHQLISEIRLCFSPGGDLIDCFQNRLARGCTKPFAYFPEQPM